MSHVNDDTIPETVVLDGYILGDVRWLLGAVEEFARFGDVDAVGALLRFVDERLSSDGLAKVAGEFSAHLHRRIEAAR
jgi:hypothetical protein